MKINKTTLSATALLALAAIAGLILLNNESRDKPDSQSGNTASNAAKNEPLSSGGDDKSRAPEQSRKRETPKDNELVEKYGDSRTNLSRHVTKNIIGMLDDAVQMAEMKTNETQPMKTP